MKIEIIYQPMEKYQENMEVYLHIGDILYEGEDLQYRYSPLE